MKVPWSRLIVLALLTCNSAHPDTITMKDNVTINGALVGMSNGVLRVRVRFPSETKEVWIKAEEVQSIEFNLLTLNAGAPPKLLGFGPPSDQSPHRQTLLRKALSCFEEEHAILRFGGHRSKPRPLRSKRRRLRPEHGTPNFTWIKMKIIGLIFFALLARGTSQEAGVVAQADTANTSHVSI